MGLTNLGGCPAPPFGEAPAALFSDTSFIGPLHDSWRRGGCGKGGIRHAKPVPFMRRIGADRNDLPTNQVFRLLSSRA